MKPRLKLEYSESLRSVAWFCRGGGALGLSACCPFHAYEHWKWNLQMVELRARRKA